MINNIEELYENSLGKELTGLFEKCLTKNKDEIIDIFKENGYEISDEFANECCNYCKEVEPVNEADLVYIAGGSDEGGCLPFSARGCLERAIKGLEKYKSGATVEIIADVAQAIIDDLKDLLQRPYDKIPFKKELSQIEIRVAFLPLVHNNGKDIALRNITEAQRITSRES